MLSLFSIRYVPIAAVILGSVVAPLFAATTESLAQMGVEIREHAAGMWYEDEPATVSLSKLLPPGNATPPSGFYTELPPNLEAAVRRIMSEDYDAAEVLLTAELEKAQTDREKARVLMWLGLAAGQKTLDTPQEGHESGSKSTLYLAKAVRLDRRVLEAPDVVRTLAEMAALNCGLRDFPEAPTVLEQAVEKAEASRKPLDYYYAGMMARRTANLLWKHIDTEQYDRRAYRMIAEALKGDPTRYEFWTQYLPALAPIYEHEHKTSETVAMYPYFKTLRHPLLVDQGPASLFIKYREGWTMAEEDAFLAELSAERPDDPFPPFQLAVWAIETTPALAVERLEKYVAEVEAGKYRIEPREEGYRASAYYKLAFLYEDLRSTTESLAMYERVKELAPNYAELNGNMANLYAKLADEETTSPRKIELMELAIEHAREQAKYDYRGRAKEKATLLRRMLLRALPAVKREVQGGTTTAGAD